MLWKGRQFGKILLWRAGAALLGLILMVLLAVLWGSGGGETRDAFESGRRLLIALESGAISGKQISTAPPKVETPAPVPQPVAEPVSEPAPPESQPDPAQPEPLPEPTAFPEIPPATEPSTPPEQPAPPVEPPMPPAEPPRTEETPPAPAMMAPVEPLPAAPAAPLTPSANPLPEPDPTLMEKGAAGWLPIIGASGVKPWRHYARPFERKGSQPMIAIVVSGMGHNRVASENALRLPENVTVSFSPYARDVASWTRTARLTAHESLFDLPMQPANYPASDPGPYGLLIEKGVLENDNRLQWMMARSGGVIGFLTPQDEAYSSNVEAFKLLLQSLANRGLMLVMGREPHKKDIRDLIDASNTPVVVADTLIDEELSAAAIQTRLTVLEQTAKKRGYAVGIAQPYPVTLEQIRQWAETLEAKGFVLVPVSAVARLKFS